MSYIKYATTSGIFEAKFGNMKIGKDTLIFNMGSATECASGKEGLCDLYNTSNCYAMRDEKRYKNPLKYHQRQENYWLNADVFEIAEAIMYAYNKRKKVKMKYVRLNEAGDMHSKECLDKTIAIANMLPNIKFYTYTHRSDLINENVKLPKNLIINTSDFTVKGFNQFATEPQVKVNSLKKELGEATKKIKKLHGKDALVCKGDCTICSYCKVNHGKKIFVPMH